ncbi:MAG: hypothetical protein ACK5RL_17780 [Acidimicrobiales bacterium]
MLGDDFLAWLTMALGGALALGTGLALLRPQQPAADENGVEGEVVRAPLGRSLIQIVIGSVAAVWALATIIS